MTRAAGGAGVGLTEDLRLMHAEEFGNDLAERAKNILVKIGELEAGQAFYLPETLFSGPVRFGLEATSGKLEVFLACKRTLINYCVDLLAKAYLHPITDESRRAYQQTCINTQLIAHRVDSALSCFSVEPVMGNKDFCKIKVPFYGDIILSPMPTDLNKLTSFQLYTTGVQSILVVRRTELKAIFGQIETTIEAQNIALRAASYDSRLGVSKARLHLEAHGYAAVFRGDSGIAYRGEGVVGLFSSWFGSIVEEKPKSNLEKVIRLLENYKNPLKALGRHHFPEIDEVIAALRELTPFYKSHKSTEVDGLIVSRLVKYYDLWEANKEHGSALRRIVYAMEALLPGIRSILAERSAGAAHPSPSSSPSPVRGFRVAHAYAPGLPSGADAGAGVGGTAGPGDSEENTGLVDNPFV